MIKKWLGTLYAKTGGSNRLERIWKLAEVDFKKRYYNDKLGVLWTILNPLFQITIFYLIFSLIREDNEDNYVLFLYLGIIAFNNYAWVGRQGLNLLRRRRYLLENIQFKKIDIFISIGITGVMIASIDFLIYFIVALALGIQFNIYLIYIFLLIPLVILLGLGTAIILSVLKLYFNDITNIWSLISFGLFWVSGVFFSGNLILNKFPSFLFLNPLIGTILNIRNILLYELPLNHYYLIVNLVQSCILVFIGIVLIKNNWDKVTERI